jgi:carbonic anhydrase/acetyltransferase-like protein (isoleucine patch superfamily)
MTNYMLNGEAPRYADEDSTYVAPGAMVIGGVIIGTNVSLWPYVVIRGDNEPIVIGAGCNIQEHSLLHTDPGFPITIGEGCTIGHRAILHGCVIGNNSLIGMGAIVLNGAKIGNNCLVGAGALVTEGKEFPDGSLIVGSPAKVVRALNEAEIARLAVSAAHYVANGRRFKIGLSEV